jgi:MFS family permease
VAAVIYTLALLLLTIFYKEPGRAHHEAARRERVSFQDILAFENFVLLTGLILAVQTIERSFGPVLPLYARELGSLGGKVELAAGLLFSSAAITGALGHQLAAMLLRRVSARAVLAMSLPVSAVALLVFAGVRPLWALMAVFGLFGLGAGTAMTAAFTAASGVIPRHAHGASFGLLSSASLIGMSIGPVLGGLVAGRSIRAVFLVAAGGLALLALAVRQLMVEPRAEVESPPQPEG